MMIDMTEYDKYLEVVPGGLAIKVDTPPKIKEALIQLDKQYYELYGTHLLWPTE